VWTGVRGKTPGCFSLGETLKFTSRNSIRFSQSQSPFCDFGRGRGRFFIVTYSPRGLYNIALPSKGQKNYIHLALSQMEKIIFPISTPTCLSVSPKPCGRRRGNYTSEETLVNIHSPDKQVH